MTRAGTPYRILDAAPDSRSKRRAPASRRSSRSENAPPDLVLLDINLPDIDGFEICRQIKNNPETERVPVMFLSAARLADLDVVAGLGAWRR